MAEILLCVHSMGGDLNAKKGDVLAVQPDGWGWGQCELGGPTYTRSNYRWTLTMHTMMFKPTVDMSGLKMIEQLTPDMIALQFAGTPVDMPNGVQIGYQNLVWGAQGVTFDYGERFHIGDDLNVPIAQHINGNHKFWRVVKAPAVTVKVASVLMTPEMDLDPANPSPSLHYRGRFLDFTKLTADYSALAGHIADDLRQNQFITVPYTAAQINTIITSTDDANCPAYHARISF